MLLLKNAGIRNIEYKILIENSLTRLMDVRFAGTAVGVGTSRILGRVHSVNLQFKDQFFSCSITILEDDKIEFLLGLDMLKRHQVIFEEIPP